MYIKIAIQVSEIPPGGDWLLLMIFVVNNMPIQLAESLKTLRKNNSLKTKQHE